MARPALSIETSGAINPVPYTLDAEGVERPVPEADRSNVGKGAGRIEVSRWRARTRLRLPDGRRTEVERWAPTKAGSIAAVKTAVKERLAEAKAPAVTRSAKTVGMVAAEWLAEDIAKDQNLSASSRRLYVGTVERHLKGTDLAGSLPREVTAVDVERLLNAVAQSRGLGVARTLKSCLLRIFGRAKRETLVTTNIVRDVSGIRAGDHKVTARLVVTGDDGTTTVERVSREHDRALEPAEEEKLLDHLALPTVHVDVADVVRLMLATGVRIGECLAFTWGDVDLDKEVVQVSGTVTRETGKGLLKGATKTRESRRPIPLAPRAVELLRRRKDAATSIAAATPVFPSTGGTFLDPSNMNHRIRRELDAIGLHWATPHSFRRTTITRLGNDPTIPMRLISDLAGHVDPGMTMRKYLGRRGANDALRAAL